MRFANIRRIFQFKCMSSDGFLVPIYLMMPVSVCVRSINVDVVETPNATERERKNEIKMTMRSEGSEPGTISDYRYFPN